MSVFLGLMSGTSLDGIDGVVVEFAAPDRGGDDAEPLGLRVLAHAHHPFAASVRAELAALNRSSHDELHRAALAANALARTSADLVARLLAQAQLAPGQITAIGSHGLTVRHRPGEFDGIGYTLQIDAPALLAELTGIDVVAGFRSRDVAAGGQGAPLVPAFHRAVFSLPGQASAVLNLGGIANLSAIAADGTTIGFDCGPANGLLDHWCQVSTSRRFDDGGGLAASGSVDDRLLKSMQTEPYFGRQPPKSTGRDLFNVDWLEGHLAAANARQRLRDADIQSTLAELTAWCCADAVDRFSPSAAEIVVCGGGTLNGDLMARLARRLAPRLVASSASKGLAPDQVEAAAFAWLAQRFVSRQPGNLASVTGARGERILGALYPAGA